MTDSVLKSKGLRVLDEHLGPVDMERFLVLLSREQCDYSEWHKMRNDTETVREYSSRAMAYQKTLNSQH